MSAGTPHARWLVGGGEMGALVQTLDWSSTPLGPLDDWPQSLRTTVNLALASTFPIAIAWGPERVQIYNDGYVPLCAGKHPRSMGQDFKACWQSVWPAIGEAFESASSGRAAFVERQRMFTDRHEYLEEAFFTFSFSPIYDDAGRVAGLFHPVTEVTEEILAERRLSVLRDVGRETGGAHTVDEAGERVLDVLARHPLDVPFALLYRIDHRQKRAHLAGCRRIEPGSPAAPHQIALDSGWSGGWPLAACVEGRAPITFDALDVRFGPLECGPYPESPRVAQLLPISFPGDDRSVSVLIAGVSPRRALDTTYRAFYLTLQEAVANALGNAQAYEIERNRAETLAELDRAKTVFFSNVSHELRTPLTLILGPLEGLMEKDASTPEDVREQLAVMHRSALRLVKLVNSILDFSRIEAGRLRAKYQPTDLARLTRDLASNFSSACEKAGLELRIDCPPLDRPVHVDRDMWEKIVLNLLSNAFKFTFEGEIELSLRAIDDEVVLSVRDTGVGIPESELPRVFERFHRVAGTRGRTHEGTGIGLALVQELAKLHGGGIDVASEPGCGTTFTATIPQGAARRAEDRMDMESRAGVQADQSNAYVEEAMRWLPEAVASRASGDSPPAASSSEPEPSEDPAQPREGAPRAPRPRILLADDNADMRRYVTQLLSPRYVVEAAADGESALGRCRQSPPDLVLSDVMMPGLDGFELLRALRANARTRSIPVVLVSARAGDEARAEGLERGADDYLVKPFAARELLARVNTQLELSRMRRESELAFQSIADTAPAMLWITDTENRCTFLSRSWYEFTGIERSPDRELDPTAALHPDDRERAHRTLQAASARREAFVLDYRLLHRADGTYRWAIDTGRPRRDDSGEWLGYIGSIIDITERKQTELLLQTQKSLLEQIAAGRPLDACLDALCEAIPKLLPGARACVLLTDTAPQRITRVRISSDLEAFGRAIEGKALADLGAGRCHDAAWAGESATCPDIAADETATPAWRDLCAVHGIRASHATPIVGADTRRRGAFMLCIDQPRWPTEWDDRLCQLGAHVASVALERDRAQLELRKSEERFRSLVEVITDVPWITDATGAFGAPQAAWEAYTGQTWTQHRGFGWLRAVHPEDRARVEQQWRDASMQQGATYHIEARLWHAATRAWRHCVTNAVPLCEADGTVREWVGTCTDVEDQRRAEAGLRNADRRKDEFLATLAHELRNPLAPIRNAVEMLRLEGPGTPIQSRAREMIDRQTQQMTRLIDDLMEVSRITTGRLRLHLESVPLAGVIQAAIETSAPLIEERGHRLKTQLPEHDIVLRADATRLAQVFSNLLNNAARYTEPGGCIRLEVKQRGEEAIVTVEDNGIGVDPEMLPVIFELFVQADRSLERSQSGLGIGLTLAKRLVEMHGGRIDAHSDGIGRGTSFQVALPILPIPSAEPPGTRPRRDATQPHLRILVADDNVDAAESLAMLLSLHAHDVSVVHDGAEAVQHGAEHRPDVILLDIGMPEMNGYEAARRIRAEAWGTGVVLIALTGWGQEGDRKRSADAGFDHHLVKPVDASALGGILATVAAQTRAAG